MFSQLAKVSRNQWLIFAAGMTAAVAWLFSRIVNINPAILHGEPVYTLLRGGSWKQTPAFDFGTIYSTSFTV